MIPYVIYSNSSYSDILKIQTDFITQNKKCILLIDNNQLSLNDVYAKYDKVVFYDNNDPYGKRIFDCLSQIDYEYFIFIHDNDILINVNEEYLNKIFKWSILNNVDKVDLKHTDFFNSKEIIKIEKDLDINAWNKISHVEDGFYLLKDEDPNRYLYNVNPSIWKKTAFLSIMDTFKYKNYRNIEDLDVQYFCNQFKIYKSYTNKPLFCGYYGCLNIFKYLHITHDGKFLEWNNEYLTRYKSSYKDIVLEYSQIIDKYNLKNSNKWIR